MKKLIALMCAALALSACSGGGETQVSVPPTTQPTGPTGPSVDAFVTYVLALIGVSDETSEPIAIDSVVATAPENTEPVAVK